VIPALLLAAALAAPLTVRIPVDSLTLVGTLALPARTPAPALILLHGSEPGRRDNAFFREVRTRLLADGWAVLTYDRRGVGESGGAYSETPDLMVPARDAIAAMRFLAARPDIGKIGLLGISQGGWVAPLAATLAPQVAFVVAISEPGQTPLEQSGWQRRNEWIEGGMSAGEAAEARRLRALLFAFWHGDVPRATADSAWAAARNRAWFARAGDREGLFTRLARLERLPPTASLPPEFAEAIRSCFFYDPLPVAARVRVPILHLYGAADRHLDVASSVCAFRGASPAARIVVLPHTGHGMQKVEGDAECLTCPPGDWTCAPGWLDTLSTWLAERR
jgi:pimeloyl-ACP methyl ester carboxylesterase